MTKLADLQSRVVAAWTRSRRGGLQALPLIAALVFGFYAAFMAGDYMLLCVLRPTPLPAMLTDRLATVVRHSPLFTLFLCCLFHGCIGLVIGWRIGDGLYRLAATCPRYAALAAFPIFFLPFAAIVLQNLFVRYGALPPTKVEALAVIGLLAALTYGFSARRWLQLRRAKAASLTPVGATCDQP
ncbi:MAG: hypothetical protein JNG89_12315 [Planctomycetaceae bacterium]|nr:hypothetical protein [Planctomycetaceae bacterium]